MQLMYLNGQFQAVYMSRVSQNFCLYTIEFIRSKLSNFSSHVSGVTDPHLGSGRQVYFTV